MYVFFMADRISNDIEKKRSHASYILAKIAKMIPYLLQSLELDEEVFLLISIRFTAHYNLILEVVIVMADSEQVLGHPLHS